MNIKPTSPPSGPTRDRWRASLALLTIVLLTFAPPIQAFKQGIHETITESVLKGLGFDDDSADEVGDSNYYTDIFESSNAAAHADGNELGAASARLRAKRTAITDALVACKRRDALDALGEALHTVQDIFSHSNSVDNGIPVTDLLGLANGTATCDAAANFAPGGLVTGYFSVGGFFTGNQCRGLPANMCCHRDLNKDDASVPNGARHGAAVNAARAATTTYLGLVEEDINNRVGGDQATQLIKMLKKKQRTVMFVIDDTGSMSSDIAGIKSSVNAFLDNLVAGDEAPTLGLVSFKDSVNNRGLSCNIDQVRSQVNGLFASGGGDCPEAMNSALLSAIFRFPRGRSDIQIQGGRILSATDASAGDASLGQQVQLEAAIRGISIDAILTGDCASDELVDDDALDKSGPGSQSADPQTNTLQTPLVVHGPLPLGMPVNKSHTGDPLTSTSARVQLRALTEQTGGILFSVSRVEVDDVVPTLLALGNADAAVLLTRSLELTAGVPVTFDIPVDDTLSEVTFLASGDFFNRPNMTLTRPDGNLALGTDPDITERLLSSVASSAIDTPDPGSWQVTLTGSGPVTLRTFGASSLRVNGLKMLSPIADPTRPEVDFAPATGQPLVGDTIIADIRFSTGPADADLALVRLDGSVVDTPILLPVDDDRRFTTEIVVPDEDFLILELSGQTAAGNDFVRQISVPVLPQDVAIVASPAVAVAPIGETAAIDLTITNRSTEPATFTFVVSTPLGWPVSFPGGTVDVAAGETITLSPGLVVGVPGNATEGDRNDMAIRLQDLNTPTRRNNASFTVVAGPDNLPPECDAAVASEISLWPPNHQFAPIDVLGVSDPDGDMVDVTITAITQDEPVDGSGSGNTAPDASGIGTTTAEVRAERAGGGDGRVYAIGFEATDGNGGTCSGEVRVGVPHNKKGEAVDSGQAYDSTVEP